MKNKLKEVPGINFNSSAYFLLIANIITIILAVTEKWSLITLLWIYWGQSVIIGIFNFVKIISLKDFDATGFRINKQPAEKMSKRFVKYYTAFFFLIHYGGFHLAYSVFLLKGFSKNPISTYSLIFVLISIGLFFINHLFSFIKNKELDSKKVKNIGTMMFFPYLRIIPMHLTIIFGGMLISSTFTLVLFMSLKTMADLIMHLIEHKV